MREATLRAISILLSTSCLAGAALAQTAPAGPLPEHETVPHETVLDEIVITSARKRTESVQQTPVAVSVLSGQFLEEAKVTNLQNIASLAPNLQITHQVATPDVAAIYLRGFGVSTNDPAVDPAVAVYIDGIYQPTVSGTLLDLFDVQQVEVLRGPQGTLLGKNSPSGAVSVTTKRPSGEFGGEVQFDYGSYDRIEARGRVDVPIIKDILAAKVSLLEEEGGGYVKDVGIPVSDMGGVNLKAGRVGLLYTPDSNFEWYVSGSGVMNRDPQQGLRDISSATASLPWQPVPYSCLLFSHCSSEQTPDQNRAGYTKRNQVDTIDVSSNATYHFDPVSITSVSGYKHYWGLSNSDIDGELEPILEQVGAKLVYDQESQEIRVGSNKGGGWDLDGKFDWVVGGFYSHEQYREDLPLRVFGSIAETGQIGVTESKALFAHTIYDLTDQWNLSFGARETWDDKAHSYYIGHGAPFVYDTPLGFHNLSFEAGTQYKITEDKMVYFRFAEGYRGGGFIGTPGSTAAAGSFQPETNNTYEIGFKTDWLDRKLRINGDLFLADYSDLQRSNTKRLDVPPFLVLVTQNVASATVQGVELEFTAIPTEALTLTGNIGYLDAKYNKFFADVIGDGIPTDNSFFHFGLAPQLTFDLRAQYAIDLNDKGTVTLMSDFNYRTSQQLQDIYAPATLQSAYGLLNASVRYDDPSGMYSVTLYGQNILDRQYKADANSNILVTLVADGMPATWGLSLSAKF
jgi:iron complex outermembrane receptor protein